MNFLIEWLGSLIDLLLNLCAQFFVHLSFPPTIGSAVYLAGAPQNGSCKKTTPKKRQTFCSSLNFGALLLLIFDLYNHMRSFPALLGFICPCLGCDLSKKKCTQSTPEKVYRNFVKGITSYLLVNSVFGKVWPGHREPLFDCGGGFVKKTKPNRTIENRSDNKNIRTLCCLVDIIFTENTDC